MSPLDIGSDLAAVLLLLAAVAGSLNERTVRMPNAVALLLVSLLASLLAMLVERAGGWPIHSLLRRWLADADLPHMFLGEALAFLLFAGALQVRVASLRPQAVSILLLSTLTVIVATVVFGSGLWLTCRLCGPVIPLPWCMVAGAILAPTDAVIVGRVLARSNLPASLHAALTGESLLNDGAGLVMVLVTIAIATGHSGVIGHGRVIIELTGTVAGGLAIGIAAGALAARCTRRVSEPLLQTTTLLALAACSYRLADACGVSGPIAVVVAGLVFSARGRAPRAEVLMFWAVLDDVLNAALFLLIGLESLTMTVRPIHPFPVLVAIPLGLSSRIIGVAAPMLLLTRHPASRLRETGIVVWSGLRGGVSVALALTIPPTPFRTELLTVCYAVVVFSIVVQGLTLDRVVRALTGQAPVVSDAGKAAPAEARPGA